MDLLDEVLDEARRTIADVEPDLPSSLSEMAEDLSYSMALVTAHMPTAKEAAEAFRALGEAMREDLLDEEDGER